MGNKELKRLMTKVAKGEITYDEAIGYKAKPKKVSLRHPKRVKSTAKKRNTLNNQKIKKEVE